MYEKHILLFPSKLTSLVDWAATTRDGDYIKMEGLSLLVTNAKHRKELVAGGLDEFLIEGPQDFLRREASLTYRRIL